MRLGAKLAINLATRCLTDDVEMFGLGREINGVWWIGQEAAINSQDDAGKHPTSLEHASGMGFLKRKRRDEVLLGVPTSYSLFLGIEIKKL